jgi:hypothetical protein
MTTSASKERPRATGAPVRSKPQLRPSNTRSSFPPYWFTYTSGTRYFRAMLLNISSRRACLPTEKGDADRLTIASAPARTSSSTGS